MRPAHKKILKLVQVLVVSVILVAVSGVVAALAYILGTITIDEFVEYFIGMFVGTSMLVAGGKWLKKEWERLMDRIEGNDDNGDVVFSEAKLKQLKSLLRK